MRVWAVNGHQRGAADARARGRRSAPWPARRSTGPRASRRPGWRAGRPRPARSSSTPASGRNSAAWRLPSVMVPVLSSSSVAQSPAASTARPDMASTLRCTRRSMPAMPMADSSAPIVVGIRHTSRATSDDDVLLGARVDGERLQRDRRQQEDDREAGQQDVEGDLVGRLLPAGPLDQGDHPVEERLARPGGDPHDDLVGQHPGAAGDRRAVAARLADDRRRLAGDGRLVDRGDALDDLAVGRDHLAGRDDHDVVRRRAATTAPARASRRPGAGWRRSRSGPCAGCRPGPCPGPRPSPRRSWRTAP